MFFIGDDDDETGRSGGVFINDDESKGGVDT
jgi:hypothetical protein